MPKIGRRYGLVAVATAILLVAVVAATLYGAWQIAVTALALLVGASIALSLESRLRQGVHTTTLRQMERSLAAVHSILRETDTAPGWAREMMQAMHREVSDQTSRVHEVMNIELAASLTELKAAQQRTREEIRVAHQESSAYATRLHDALRSDIKQGRKLDGERHARTRKALAGLVLIESKVSDQAAALMASSEARERRLLGIIAAERVRMHDRHQELLESRDSSSRSL